MTTSRPPFLPVDGDNDAFDTADDITPYILSPDEIREDMARYNSDPESNREDNNATSTGGFFMSVSTSNDSSSPNNPITPSNDADAPPNNHSAFPNDPSTPPNESPRAPSLHLSLSSNFSTISLSTPNEDRPPGQSIGHQEPSPSANGNSYLSTDEVLSSEQEITISLPPETPNEIHTPERSLSASPPETPNEFHTPERNPSISSLSITEGPASREVDPSSYPVSAPPASSFSLPSVASINKYPGLVEKPRSRRSHRSTGPSTFEKVRSHTRPIFLPPKPTNEDQRHMADWHQMMKSSRLAAEKRRQALQERRLAREKVVFDSLPIWENEILPNWRVVFKNPELRKLWWRGIPSKLRAPLWESAVGNGLALSKDHYRSCLSRAKRALTSGVFPQPILDMIEEDISTTLPALHIFLEGTGPLYGDLKEMLCAWVVSRSDEGLEYAFGAARIAAMLLINMPSQQSFVVMRNLLERHCLRSFFGGERAKDDVDAYCRIFDTMLADGMPKIYFNFKQHQISPSEYLPGWLIPLFLDHLPFEACARIWDVLLLEGDSFLYRTSLGILGVLEPRLFFPERKELIELLRGENKPAIEVAKREGRTLNGGKYEIYGLDEETLWERIDAMDGWWKDSTWTRLIQRELPDL